jgi:gliding motility-associated-like protein
LTSNRYVLWKDGARFRELNDTLFVNNFTFPSVQARHAGVYEVRVTNPNAPLLTLISRKITVVVNPALVDTTACRYKDSLALVDLYRSYGGTNWHPDYQWRFNRPMTEWKGVQLNLQGCVKCLDLDGDVNMCGSWSELPPGIGISSSTFPMPLCRLSSLELLLLRGNRGLRGSLPDSIQYLANLKGLHLDQCSLSGPFPNGFRFLRNLGDFTIYDNRLNTFLPTFLKDLKKLGIFHASNCQLYDTIPSEIGEMDSLQIFNVNGNNLTGQIPNSFLNRTFHKFEIANNQFDSLPPLVMRDIVETLWWQRPTFLVQNNKFTFDDLLPILLQPQVVDSFYVAYAPQAQFFVDTTFTKNIGETVTVDLKIDAAITDNNYRWFKNGVEVPSLFSQKNTLILRGVLPCDAGTYTVEVTNPAAPLLTLKSKTITINVNQIAPQTRNKVMCYGQKDTLPSGQIVAPVVSTNYRETLRNRANTCDSALITTNLTVSPIVVVNKMDSFCFGKTYMLPQTNRMVDVPNFYQDTIAAADGCKTRYTTTLTYKTDLKRTENITICTGQSYNLTDTTVNTEGSFTRRKSSLVTCDSVITTNLTLLPIPTMAKIDSFCFGKTYAFSHINQTTRNTGFFVDTVAAADGCKTRYTTTLTYKTDLKRTENVTICTGQSYNLIDSTVNTEGSFTRRKSGLVTCDSVITTNLRVLPIPTMSKIDSFCEGKTYNLPQTNRIVRATGVFRDTVRNANNCIIHYATTLTYRQNLTRAERITICDGQFYKLPNDSIVRNAGVYISRKATIGCDSIITTTLIVNPKPTAQIVGLNTLYCRDNTPVTLQGQPTGGAFSIDGKTASNFTPSVLVAGNHTVSYIYRAANGCFDTTVQTMRLGDFGRNIITRTICPGDSVTIEGNVYHQRNLSSTKTLSGAAVSGCDSIITVQVAVHQRVNALDDDLEVLKNSTEIIINVLKNDFYPPNLYELTLRQRPSFGTIEELNDDNFKLNLKNLPTRDLSFTYQLCHLNCVNECDTATVRLIFKEKANELDPISAGISPNGDGKNDVLDLPNINWSLYPESDLEIYNRWGQKVYAAQPYKRDWIGQNTDGKDLPVGDYFLILRLSKADGKIIVGNLYLTR